ncbi:AMP-binding protein [Micromonospora sp. DT31]|uniref:AMP-binding protein n=1 Tax=Micromonospora sp. DT31 TaxID=3393434 RepID=UPI003CF24B71
MRTVVDAITDQADGSGTLTLLNSAADVVDGLPWPAVHDRARRMSTVLAERGLGPGCRVGLIGDTSVDLVAALQAIWLTGGAVNLMPPYARGGPSAYAEYLLAVLADAQLDLVVVDGLVTAASVMSAVTDVVTLAELADRAGNSAPATPHRPEQSDLALLQYTSGSTRIPRGVPVTHGHLVANIEAIKVAIDHDAGHPDPMFSWLPLYHDMGLIAFLAMPMSCGCPLVLQPPTAFAQRPGSWLDALSRYRVTMSGGPNFAYALMTRLLRAGGGDLDLSGVRCLVSGGEPIDAAMMVRFAAAAAPFGLDPSVLTPAYGLAEATLAATVSPVRRGVLVDLVDQTVLETAGRAEPGNRPLVRVGRPVRDTAVRVVDQATGDLVAERIVGQVQVRGPSVVGHYWGETRPPAGSWLPTGDLGYLTGGELVICGREKDVLFAAGRNVFPQDIEVVAAEVAGVRPGGAVAFGLPDPRGDRLVVAIEARAGDADRLRREVAAAVLDEVGLAPTHVAVVPYGGLPKTSSGKLRRAEARRRYVAGDLTQEAIRTQEMENQ